ncbi:calcium-activated chloride channel regulator 1-like isoform X1 [Hypanus sabinus]|uniref:calcium-activated chloride channel regulator 1-like isoform X1 n=1 Tax=Hypanus sabinus TaxID=79690 RepID=UPI0028C4BF88|nr:calcium-activated chloride channel regulator 1-like isoform X1 [Hypanus sabinus]
MTLTLGSLIYSLLSVCIIKCSKVTLVNNGYRNIVFAINPSLQFNPKLIENIQEMMTEASSYLYKATKHQLYFSDVKILLPAVWPLNSSLLQKPTTQSYEKANVIIAEPYLKYGDAPYTLQYGGCGEKGRYIHFTPNFMINDEMTSVYGPKGRVFVHEWARFRWGVFNEHNDLIPFYSSNNGTSEATRCSLSIKGTIAECKGSSCSTCTIDQSTRLPNKECRYFPEKNQPSSSSIMYLQGLPNVDKFCDAETHNAEAPNMQNEMCNYESIWDVMNKSEDFRNISSPHTGSVKPNFILLQAKYRVVCLVLDVSGSMGSANRIVRLRQAAEIFLLQIAETGSQVGIVTFNHDASIKTQLKRIDNDTVREHLVQLLPTSAGGGTRICAGVRAGFQVLHGDDNATKGDEIILLTDGIDNQISTCFPEAEGSGAVIHTIALGPSAAEELEQLSTMTGGLQFAATDNLDTSGLIDSFTGLTSGNGDSSQQAIQLENLGRSIGNDTWLNGTVVIDETIGNDTSFIITWETQTPYILLHDPSGKSYNNSDFNIDEIVRTARLKIYGTAQTGTWIYSILNPGGNQVITITVTSRAADSAVPPIIAKGYINRKDSTGPIIINVEVSHGFLPILYANVTAIIERPSGPPIVQVLSDDGLGADIVRNDGIYSKYFFSFNGTGRYSVKVRVQGTAGTTRITIKKGLLMPIPGYTENGNIEVIPQQSQANKTHLNTTSGDFNRVQAGGTISLPSDPPPVDFPPCKITDLRATIVKNEIKLEWTAPGGDYDQGSASRYELRMSDNLLLLRDNFPKALLINLTDMHPQPYGSKETVFFPEKPSLQNGATVYFAVRAYDKSNHASEMSNIARVTFFVLLVEPLVDLNDNYVPAKAWIAAVVIGILGLIAGIIIFIMHAKRPKKISAAA